MTEPAAPYKIIVRGAPRTPLTDLYFGLMRLRWPATLGLIVGSYLLVNALFGFAFAKIGGVDNMRPGSFIDGFYFSVQTMGTIGYGTMSPWSTGANAMVVVESVVSILFIATATGLVFAKFSRPNARMMFTRQAVIGPMNGVPTLSFRLGNQRTGFIVEALVRAVLVRTEITSEGRTLYRMVDLPLARDRVLSLSRSWSVMHVIDQSSPLYGETAESLAKKDAELLVSVTGTDDTWMQTVHASHRYLASEIAWNARHVDVLTETETDLILDLTKFHDVEPH